MDESNDQMEFEFDDKQDAEVEKKAPEPPPPFITVPLLRGFTEIRHIYEVATNHNAIICGGWARYCASPLTSPAPATDVDVFPREQASFDSIKEFLLKEGFTVYHENPVSLTLKNPIGESKWAYTPRIQLIKPVVEGAVFTVGTVEEILSNFDFTVVRAAILDQDKCIVDGYFPEDESNKRIRLKTIHCPISSMQRCMKYAAKGYWCPPSEALKLFMDWEQRDGEYRVKIIDMLKKSVDNPKGMTKEDLDELEALLRID